MKLWPFGRRAVETRNYTDQQVAAATVAVTGSAGGGVPAKHAAVQAAAGAWARAMASGRVAGFAGRVLNPALLHDLGRSLVLYGEAVYRLVGGMQGLSAVRASAWDVSGVDVWSYLVSTDAPSGNRTARLPAGDVLHPRINADPTTPHVGQSPLVLADDTMKVASGMESSMRREAGATTGYVIPAPIEGMGDDDFEQLATDVRSLNGGTRMVPSMEGGFGDPVAAGRLRGNNNWNPQRIGFSPTQELVALRSNVGLSVLAACGVPPELFAGDSDGTGRREAWRQFLHGTIQPVADVVAVEFSEKLETDVRFDFDGLFASDVQGRGRAFQSLRSGGLSVADSARATGIQVSDAPGEGA